AGVARDAVVVGGPDRQRGAAAADRGRAFSAGGRGERDPALGLGGLAPIVAGSMAAPRFLRLRRTRDRRGINGGDPLPPAPPPSRAPRDQWRRPASSGSAALAIAAGS